MKTWRIVVLIIVAVVTIGLGILKENRIGGDERTEPGTLSLGDRISAMEESAEPFVLIFYTEPGDFCCEGTRIFYEDMRRSAQEVVTALEGKHPCLFVDVNLLSGEDRDDFLAIVKRYSVDDANSAVVVGSEGSKIKEYYAPFDSPEIVAYLQEQ